MPVVGSGGTGREREEAGISERAEGTFEICTREEAPYDERKGTRLSRSLVTKAFRGVVQGPSRAELLVAYGAEEGSSAYVGMERVGGSVHGRSVSFVLSHGAAMGEFRGLRGEARISVGPDIDHSFELDYELA